MRILFALLLIILGPSAWAADCGPWIAGGTGGPVSIVTTVPGGVGAGYMCIVDGKPMVQTFAMRDGFVPGAGCASSSTGLVRDLINQNINTLLAKCSAEWPANDIATRDAIYAAVIKNVSIEYYRTNPVVVVSPAPKVCTVAVNGTAKTRQWYPFAAGARTSTTGGGSVAVGTACKLDVATVTEGSTIYGAFGPTYRADRVTVCTCQ